MVPDKQSKVIISYRCFKISAESCMKFPYKLIGFYVESQNCFTIPYHPLDNYISIYNNLLLKSGWRWGVFSSLRHLGNVVLESIHWGTPRAFLYDML